ncbi:cleavage stimulation factor subunit 50-like [Tasmannia lanceolata]|uniref:cleavage stimulation factor subunit 50-like n=1 Tax=Tasmannia lanceolata TaxID=3420 RepID=UPI004062C74F
MTTTHVTIQGLSIRTAVVSHSSLVDNYINELKSYLGFHPKNVVGLDVEWKPNTSAGITNKVAILQLCAGESQCYIFQLLYFDTMPQSLKSFLADPNITFVGVGIKEDAVKLAGDYGLQCGNYVELGPLAARLLGSPDYSGYNLENLAREVVGLNIEKRPTVTRSNWSERQLSEEQVKYAAIDAYASYRIGKKKLAIILSAIFVSVNVARCARFSSDGRFVATGSTDTSIKLFEISKVKQMMLPDARDGPVRPVIRTFYDHLQPINDLDFHPQSTVLISGAKDHTIKFFDFSKTVAKRAFRVIQDTHNVRSVSFHPSGEFLLAGTDHPIAHLYDINTFQCYLSSNVQEINSNGAINQEYAPGTSYYVIPSGTTGAHVYFMLLTAVTKFVLSCGKDSTAKLWEVGTGRLVKQYTGAIHTQLRCQAVFNETEEFVLSVDEPSNEIVIWDALTAEKVARWPSNHIGAPRWLEHSPTEAAFVSCGSDRSVRFWKEIL